MKQFTSIIALAFLAFNCNPIKTEGPDVQSPTVSIRYPVSGSELKTDTTYTVIVDASDNKNICSVDIYIDGHMMASINFPPYQYRWNTKGNAGNHSISAIASDVTGNVGSSSVVAVMVNVSLVIDPDIELVFVPGGTYQMGSLVGTGRSDEQPRHSVTIKDFYISKTEVTRKQWRTVVDWAAANGGTTLLADPSYHKTDDNLPVERVSWDDVQIWLVHLRNMNNSRWRLPSEAEWEYAARGGANWTDNYTYSGSNNINAVAWYTGNSSSTNIVKTKNANQLGIYDMSGNVVEWCEDWYHPDYNDAPTDGSSWLTKDVSFPYRVVRGGSYPGEESRCRAGARSNDYSNDRYANLGIRLARTP